MSWVILHLLSTCPALVLEDFFLLRQALNQLFDKRWFSILTRCPVLRKQFWIVNDYRLGKLIVWRTTITEDNWNECHKCFWRNHSHIINTYIHTLFICVCLCHHEYVQRARVPLTLSVSVSVSFSLSLIHYHHHHHHHHSPQCAMGLFRFSRQHLFSARK